LVVQGMYQHALAFFRLEGEIAVPSAIFSKGPFRSGALAKVPQPEKGRWIWRDLNGDGDFQRDEFMDAGGIADPAPRAWWVGDEWGQVGSEILRFDHWRQGNRAPRWRIALPYAPETHTRTPGASASNQTIKAFCTAGDYAFAVESRTAKVHLYRLDTGEKAGE